MSLLKVFLSVAAIAAVAFDAGVQGVSLDPSALLPQPAARVCAVADAVQAPAVLAAR